MLAVLVVGAEHVLAAQKHLDLNDPSGRNASSIPSRARPAPPALKRHKRYLLWEGGGISKVGHRNAVCESCAEY